MILLIYLLKLVGCSAILTAYYYCFLRNRSFHMYNRYFVLLIFILSVTLPFVRIPYLKNQVKSELPNFTYTSETLPEVMLTKNGTVQLVNLPMLLTVIYLIVLLVCVYRILKSIRYLQKISKRYPYVSLGKLKLFFTDEPGTPFSFFNWIFWNSKISTESPAGKRVLQHELYHIREKHSLDLFFVECVIAVCWFNPFFYFLKKELTAIHEFLADKAAAGEIGDEEYAELLLLHAISEKKQQLTHSFFQSNIKRRINMITQKNKTSFAYVRRLMSLPIMFVVCLACSRSIDDKDRGVTSTTLHESNGALVEVQKKDIDTLFEKIVQRDTVRITPQQLENLLSSKVESKSFSSRNVGDVMYMTFDEESVSEGPVYAIPTAAQQEWQKSQPVKRSPAVTRRSNPMDYNQTFTKVEIEADYPGGSVAWARFLNKNVSYPKEAVDKEIQGTVVVQFIVEKDGSLSDIEAITGPEALQAEAVKVITNTGKWLPAMQNGKQVRSYKKQPITFRLQSE